MIWKPERKNILTISLVAIPEAVDVADLRDAPLDLVALARSGGLLLAGVVALHEHVGVAEFLLLAVLVAVPGADRLGGPRVQSVFPPGNGPSAVRAGGAGR